MKKRFLDFAMNTIDNKFHYSEKKQLEIRYGLECIYSLVTKLSVIFIIAIIFNYIKELLLLVLFYNFIRAFGDGLHAKSNIKCWIISLFIFTIVPLCIKYISLNFYLSIWIFISSCVVLIIFAPADTKKKPQINSKKRKDKKIRMFITCISYALIFVFWKNELIRETIVYSCLLEAIMINPISYWLCKEPYNNYKDYLLKRSLNI